MSAAPIRRSPSEVLRRGYSDDELDQIYELGRFFLENGDLRRGEVILHGVSEIAPDYLPALLGLFYIHFQRHEFELAASRARQALQIDPENITARLYLAAVQLSQGDYPAAGANLGEVGERINDGLTDDPRQLRFYKGQLARYQHR